MTYSAPSAPYDEAHDGEPILVGVAWPYASGPRHLGHAAGAYVPPDIFARYQRMIGNRVLMVSGSDMHGTPITVAADRRGLSARDVAKENHALISKAFQRLGLSYDLYTSTLTPTHYRVTQEVFLRLYERGYLFTETTLAMYDPEAQRFLPDRYIEGTCPHCGYTEARGDQCDNCGRTLDPTDLIDPRSTLSGAAPTTRETTHFFLDLPKFTEPLLAWIETVKDHWRPNVTAFTLNWIREGLKPRAITRDIDWGVPIPLPGYDDKRIYVWFDAVIGYFSATVEWAERQGDPEAWRAWWTPKADGSPPGRIYNFIGKDNIPFHTIIWPAILLGVGDLALPYDVPANEFLTLSGKKLSSSRAQSTGRLPWLHEFLEGFDADTLRFFVTINAPETRDTDFSWDEFQRRTNDELVGIYGNAVHRLLRFVERHYAGLVPTPGPLTDPDRLLLDRASRAFAEVGELIERCRLRDGLRAILTLARELNRYLDESAPWTTIKTDRERASTALWVAFQVVSAFRVLTAPYLPFSADRLHGYLGGTGSIHALPWQPIELAGGQATIRADPLFPKLEDDRVAGFIERLDAPASDAGEPG